VITGRKKTPSGLKEMNIFSLSPALVQIWLFSIKTFLTLLNYV
jgi:hypothetical protein